MTAESEGGQGSDTLFFYPQLKINSCLSLNGPIVVMLVIFKNMLMTGHFFI